MGLLDSITAFLTDTVTVTRTPAGVYSGGLWVPNTAGQTTFKISVCIQPATGMQRVVGGKDMLFEVDVEITRDVRQIFTQTELKARSPAWDPDLITYDGSTWTVFRVEPWTYDGQTFWRCVMTRQTLGAS